MPKLIDHVERVSESFDVLSPRTQGDMVCELFGRLTPTEKASAWRAMQFHARLRGLTDEKRRRNGTKPEEATLLQEGGIK